MSSKDLERRLGQLTWPEPSTALRTRVRSLAVSSPKVSSVDRVWFSRAWRLSAVGVVAALVVLEVWSSQMVPGRVESTRQVESSLERAVSETERDLGLPADTLAALARRGRTVGVWPEDGRLRDWSALTLFDRTGDRR